MDPENLSFEYPDDFPSFEDVVVSYSDQNPEYREINTDRTRQLIKPVFLDDEGETYKSRKIENNKEVTRVRVHYLVSQLEASENWQKEREAAGDNRIAASDKEFEESPRTFFKTVQEILTQPTERIAIEREDKRVESGDLSEVIIDPERITPKLLSALGLDEYIPPKGSRMSRAEKMAFMARAIPVIKEMLESAEPMSLPYKWHESQANYFRLMRIGKGKNRGYVIGTQVIRGKKVLFKTDLHGAYRRLTHIMQESYREEIRVLTQIQSKIREIHRNLGDWPMTAEEIENTREELMACVDRLKHVTNEHKTEMRERIANAVSLESERVVPAKYKNMPDGSKKCVREEVKISQFNPGAKRATLVTIPNFIEKRKAEIRSISQHLAKDRVVSDDFIANQQEPFEGFYRTVEKLHPKFKVFNLDENLELDERQKIARNLVALRQQCNPEDSSTRALPLMEPYLSFGEKMVEHIDKTLNLLDKGETLEVRYDTAAEFMKIYLITKIQHFYIQLQRVYEKHLSPKDLPNFSDVEAEMGRLAKLIGQKRVTAEQTLANGKGRIMLQTPEYNEIYHDLYALVADLKGMAQAAHQLGAQSPELFTSADDPVKDQQRIRQEMKNVIKSFRFDDLIRSM